MVPIGHIHCNQECRRGHKHELKTPETDVGDGEELIIADILTARLRNRHRHTECSIAESRTVHSCFTLCPSKEILLQPQLVQIQANAWRTRDYLQCVTGEVRLLVPPDALSSNNQYHDSENKQHGEPDFTKAGGVSVGPDQLSVQSRPRHPGEAVRNMRVGISLPWDQVWFGPGSYTSDSRTDGNSEEGRWQEMKAEMGDERKI